MKKIKIIIGLNFVTTSVTFVLMCVEAVVLILCVIGQATKGDGEWLFALKMLAVLAAIWVVCFLIALAVCRKRLVLTGHILMVTKGKNVLYQTPIEDIAWLDYDPFNPMITEIGQITFRAKTPVPENIYLYMGWVSYRRVKKYIDSHKDCSSGFGSIGPGSIGENLSGRL